jgi:predicted secreted protein
MSLRDGWRALLVILPLAGTCACGTEPTAPDAFNDPSVMVRSRPGQDFVLQLESNPSTGFSWRLAHPVEGPVVVFIESKYAPPSDPRAGAAGAEHWRFRAVERGQTTIDLEYVRPWESAPPARSVSFSILVD